MTIRILSGHFRFTCRTETMSFYAQYTGREALDFVKKGDVSLVLLDIMMPEMDGITALRAIREKSNVPVILITAKSEDADKVLGLDVGADDYITKPFNPIEVLARVRSQLRRYNKLGGSEDSNKKEVLSCGGVTLDDCTKQVTMDGEEVSLTPTEYEILKIFNVSSKAGLFTKTNLQRGLEGYANRK